MVAARLYGASLVIWWRFFASSPGFFSASSSSLFNTPRRHSSSIANSASYHFHSRSSFLFFFFFFVSLSSFIIRDFLRFHSSEFFLHLPNLDFYSCPQISFNFCSLVFLSFYILCSSFMVLTESCIIDFSKTCLNFPTLHSFDELFSFVLSMLLY